MSCRSSGVTTARDLALSSARLLRLPPVPPAASGALVRLPAMSVSNTCRISCSSWFHLQHHGCLDPLQRLYLGRMLALDA